MKRQTPTVVHYTTVASPVGSLTLFATETALTGLSWENEARATRLGAVRAPTGHPVLKMAAQQLSEYFAGRRTDFDIPLSAQGTQFQRKAWQQLRKIPYGKQISYGEQAKRIGKPKAVRAVGGANSKNPIGIIIPCHRVIGANGNLTGFAGGIDIKRRLLILEGACGKKIHQLRTVK